MACDYLAEFDAAADSDKQMLVNQWMINEPLPFFKQLREQRPVLVTPECVLVALFDDVRHVLSSPDIFTTQLYLNNIYTSEKNTGHFFAHDNDPVHDAEKEIMKSVLRQEDLPKIRQLIKEKSREVLDQSQGNIELVNGYARKVSLMLVQKYFGLDAIEPEKLQLWGYWNQYQASYNHHFSLCPQEESVEIERNYKKYSKEMVVYLRGLLLKKWFLLKFFEPLQLISLSIINFFRKFGGRPDLSPANDIVKRLLRISASGNPKFSMLRVGVNAGALLVGTVENTSGAIVNIVNYLVQNPPLLKQAQDAAKSENRETLDKIIREVQAFAPLTPYLFRQTNQEVIFAKGLQCETKVSAGTTVLALTQSAVFDNNVVERPENFEIDRERGGDFTYGFGIHECVGKHIAMQVIPEMLNQLLLRENLLATSDVDYNKSPFPEKYKLSWNI